MQVSDWAVVAEITAAVILAITAGLIYRQISEQTKLRRLTAHSHLFDVLSSTESRIARRIVYKADKCKSLKDRTNEEIDSIGDLEYSVGRVTSDYNLIGRLVHTKELDPTIAFDLYADSAVKMYNKLENYMNNAEKEYNQDMPPNLKYVERYKYFREFASQSFDRLKKYECQESPSAPYHWYTFRARRPSD